MVEIARPAKSLLIALLASVVTVTASCSDATEQDSEPSDVTAPVASPGTTTAPEPGQEASPGTRLLLEEWEILNREQTGPTHRTGIAFDRASLAAIWSEAGLAGDLPAVDFREAVVVWLASPFSSSCPQELRGMYADHVAALVYGDFVVSGDVCTSDDNPEAFIVRLLRSDLPPPPFAIQLGPEDPPLGQPQERTLVLGDLRPLGSALSDNEISTDPSLFEASERGRVVLPGDIIEPAASVGFDLELDCMTAIGPFNGVTWEPAAGPAFAVSPFWLDAEKQGVLATVLSLSADSQILTLEANGHREEFRPSSQAAGCAGS